MVKGCLLRIVGISKSFGQSEEKRVVILKDVTLLLRRRDVMALMGPNGAGKTTLLNIIGGDLLPDSGSIELQDEDILTLKPYRRYRRIGRVHQESYKSLATDLKVSELLAIAHKRNAGLGLRRISPTFAMEAISALSPELSKFLEKNIHQPARTMSGGQRQLLCLALAILGNPRLLLLDEHLASLDEQYRDLADLLLAAFVQASECAVLSVTHDRIWAETNCTGISKLEAGRLIVSIYREPHRTNDDHEAF